MVSKLPPIDPDALFTPKQAWTLLGISKSTLYAYDAAGHIGHEVLQVNGRRVYRGRAILQCHKTI